METNRINGRAATLEPDETSEEDASPSELSPRTIASAQQRFRIPGDVIAKTCEPLPDAQRHAIKWAAGYCRERNLSCEDFGAMLAQPGDGDKSYSGDSVYAAFTGRRDQGSLDRFCGAIHQLRKRVDETSSRHTIPFIETTLSKSIFATCRRALTKRSVTFIFGESQIGKTRTLEEYARRHNHGETIMVRMPTGGSLKNLLVEFAIRFGFGTSNKGVDLRRRIIESFDDRMCLIVDECEQCLIGTSDHSLVALEFAREIFDRRKCGLVLCGALSFRNALRTNYSLKKLWRRGIKPLQLPNHPSPADLTLFAAAFHLSAAENKNVGINISGFDGDGNEVTQRLVANPLKLQSDVIRAEGLGHWLAILEEAADLAKEKGSKLNWGHVIAAHSLFQIPALGE